MKTTMIFTATMALLLSACQSPSPYDIKKESIRDTNNKWNIEITYSTIKNGNKTASTYNALVKQEMENYKKDFMQETNKQKDELKANGYLQNMTYQLLINDSVYIVNNNIISTCITYYAFTGGANGILFHKAINFDLKNNKCIEKLDLFNMNQKDSLNILLKTYLQDPYDCYTFAEPTIDNCSAVNIGIDSLYFTYDKYVLSPGCCGPTTISIPRNKLKGIAIL